MKLNPEIQLLVLPALIAAYCYWCVSRGFVWLRSEKIERKKDPSRFKFWARTQFIVLGLLAAFILAMGFGLLQP